jgi:hypothetical protein
MELALNPAKTRDFENAYTTHHLCWSTRAREIIPVRKKKQTVLNHRRLQVRRIVNTLGENMFSSEIIDAFQRTSFWKAG